MCEKRLSFTTGARLGSYEILSALGVGGMGEVYRARDTKLNRDVALKILPEMFATDNERLARFKREAQVLASLNHPNIAAIYGFEDSSGIHALVMELVEGPTLADRITQGPIPIDDALPMARQIAEALESAHEQGIIHRDLKPANIKVRPDGAVKVLDFGLAKALEPMAAIDGDATASPTITSPAMTRMGMILGTAAYMSPEQAKGRPADKRSDVWAFGVVLYEMLSGQRAFKGDDIADTLAAVLRQDIDWTPLPDSTPPSVRRLIARCLDRDVRRRLRDIGEARIVLDDPAAPVFADAPGAATLARHPSVRLNRVAWLIAALSTIALIATVLIVRRTSNVTLETNATQFTILAPDKTSFGGPPGPGTGGGTQVAVSPDGRNIVFVAGARPAFQIWLRPVATLAATPIPGTEGGSFPFWSPDSRFIGFFAAGKLKKVALGGGPPIVLCDAFDARGGSWSRDNVILFAPVRPAGLLRVSSAGGTPTGVTTIAPPTGEDNHRWPHFLPDGQHFFYTAITGACCPAAKPSTIKIGSLDAAGAAVPLLQAESPASYASGHVFFARDDTLMAQPFDPEARQLTGDAFPVAEHVRPEGSRYVGASVSANGTLVYASDEGLASRQLNWFDRAGRTLGTLGDAGPYDDLALSPDELRVAVTLGTGSPENRDIWIIDLTRNLRSRLTVDPGIDASPLWSPDGTHIVFQAQRPGKVSLRQQLANGTGADESLLEVPSTPSRPCDVGQCNIIPNDWSADGRSITYTFQGSFPRTSDVWILPLFGDRKPFPLVQTEFLEGSGTFSPDGRWIAYTTSEPGQPNVYVQPFLRTGGKYRISRDGGHQPLWRADGKELFYLGADGTMMTVPIGANGPVDAGEPQALFRTGAVAANFFRRQYAVTKDGQRFLVNAPSQQSMGAHLTVFVNWTAAIQK
jgi:serine/threonine protein kinase/Tol biopolymer transport system component